MLVTGKCFLSITNSMSLKCSASKIQIPKVVEEQKSSAKVTDTLNVISPGNMPDFFPSRALNFSMSYIEQNEWVPPRLMSHPRGAGSKA